jgi:hypothetical protein
VRYDVTVVAVDVVLLFVAEAVLFVGFSAVGGTHSTASTLRATSAPCTCPLRRTYRGRHASWEGCREENEGTEKKSLRARQGIESLVA